MRPWNYGNGMHDQISHSSHVTFHINITSHEPLNFHFSVIVNENRNDDLKDDGVESKRQ